MTTSCKLVSIEYLISYPNEQISESEKLALAAMLKLQHLAGLGLLLSRLTDPLNVRCRADREPRQAHAWEDELDQGLNALGEIVAAIAGGAIGDLDEAFKEHSA